MTISESICKWLDANGVELDYIYVDMLPPDLNALAIMKSPTNTVQEFIDGSQLRTEYYTIYARKASQFEDERRTNNAYFEKFENDVVDWNLQGNLPVLDGNRYCENVSISGTAYLFQTQENESVYSLTFEIIYRKEVNHG